MSVLELDDKKQANCHDKSSLKVVILFMYLPLVVLVVAMPKMLVFGNDKQNYLQGFNYWLTVRSPCCGHEIYSV